MKFEELKLQRFEIKWLGRPVPVFRPLRPVQRAFATAHANADWYLVCGLPAFRYLSRLIMFSATHRSALVHIPLRGTPRTHFEGFEPHDLVLVHHSLQFQPSAWKEVRSKLGVGRQCSFLVPVPSPDDQRPTAALIPDRFDLAQHSRTVFIVGSQPLFRFFGSQMSKMAQCTELGDHTHFFGLARKEPAGGQPDDMTMVYWTVD